MAKTKGRGRVGGYGRTGDFVKAAEYNRWYSTKQIKEYFHQRGDLISHAQAKAVFEALERGKCYRTQRQVVGTRLAIKLLPPLPEIEVVPDYLLKICSASIHSYLTSLILQTAFGTPLKSMRREYPLNSEELQEVVQLQMFKLPIELDGVKYSIAAWDQLDNCIRVLFKEIPQKEPARAYS